MANYKRVIRDKRGRFSRGSLKLKAIIVLVGVISVVSVAHADFEKVDLSFSKNPEDIARTIADKYVGEKIVELENELLATLGEGCETLGVKDPDGAVILDTNDRMSIGRYQWQRESVIYYYEKLYGETLTMSEAIAVAIDQEKSTELTRDVLFTEPKGYTNWLNCSKKHDIKGQVELINKLR